jgi:carboxylate-amine ligase
VRPHHAFGTVEVRICDAQPSATDSNALAALIVACVAQSALDLDDGVALEPAAGRVVEENLWRAIRYGLDGRMIDLDRLEEYPAAALPDRLLAWTAPARSELGIDPVLPTENATQRQRRALAAGATIADAFAAETEAGKRTYATEEVTT